jgi:hypothetical protein
LQRSICERATVALVLAALAIASPVSAADSVPTEPRVSPNLVWMATQFLPSPGLGFGVGPAYFGLRWQVTPLLYSWGIHRGLSPWRVLVAEPLTRQNGSIEAYLSPEFLDVPGDATDKWLLRPGVRAYFPLAHHGEYLSMSLGTSYQNVQGKSSAAFEGGAYVLFGLFGLQASYAPAKGQPAPLIVTFRVRYF